MRFLLRMTFWLTVILVLLPSGGSQPTQQKANVGALETVSAAMATITDMRSFCERQPEACVVGSQAAAAIGQRAQAGARMLYDYLSEHRADTTASAGTRSAAAARPSQNTLTPADLAPTWRGPPVPRKDRPA
jgi:hypothetical protein